MVLGYKADQWCHRGPNKEYEVAGQTFLQMFHSLSSSWPRLRLCEDDTVSHWSKQNKFLPTVAVKMNINTELSLDASNFPVLSSRSTGNSCDLVPAFSKKPWFLTSFSRRSWVPMLQINKGSKGKCGERPLGSELLTLLFMACFDISVM